MKYTCDQYSGVLTLPAFIVSEDAYVLFLYTCAWKRAEIRKILPPKHAIDTSFTSKHKQTVSKKIVPLYSLRGE